MVRKWWIAAGSGLIAGLLVFVQLHSLQRAAEGGRKVSVLVLRENLARGVMLNDAQLAVREIPAAWVDERTVRETHRHELVGMKLAVPVKAAQMLQWTDFESRKGGPVDLAEDIPPGNRAVTIPVTSAISMGGLLRPGHRVDILATLTDNSGSRAQKITRTLLQNITVLAVGTDTDGATSEGRFNTVTLSVTTDQGEELANAASTGILSVSLRGYADTKLAPVEAQKASEVLAQPRPDPPSLRGHAIEQLTTKK